MTKDDVDKMLQILQNNKVVRSQNLYHSPIRIQLHTKPVDVSGKNKNKNKTKTKNKNNNKKKKIIIIIIIEVKTKVKK